MITYFGAYIKTIVSFMLILVLVEIIVPEGGYKKYIKLIMGLIITLSVLKPISGILGLNQNELAGLAQRKTEEIWEGNFDFSHQGESLELTIFKMNLEESITQDANAIKTEVVIQDNELIDGYGSVLGITIYKAQGEEGEEKNTLQYLKGKYGIALNNMEVIYQ
ncbi:MAG: stage III sporulation protein AF [Anaerotignaceae bacterium]